MNKAAAKQRRLELKEKRGGGVSMTEKQKKSRGLDEGTLGHTLTRVEGPRLSPACGLATGSSIGFDDENENNKAAIFK